MRITPFMIIGLWTLSAGLFLPTAAHPTVPAVQTATPSEKVLTQTWDSFWISSTNTSPYDYGVYHFRRNFELKQAPDTFVINISADNRYRLYVNGTPVCWGPARGDRLAWNYETLDIAPFLRAGKNTLAVLVWNLGIYRPCAQLSNQTGLIVQGNGPSEAIVSTTRDAGWLARRDQAFGPLYTSFVGTGDSIRGEKYLWGWEQPDYDDSAWEPAVIGRPGTPYGTSLYGGYDWGLVPREIPLMEETLQRIPQIRRSEGLPTLTRFIDGNDPLTVPAHTTCSILLDQTFLTNAYPELLISGGKGACIRMSFAEALFDEHHQKGNRNDIDNRNIKNGTSKNYDLIYPDGADHRLYRTLWFRTFRYLQLEITTADQPLVLEDLYGMFTGYPFRETGSFSSDDPLLDRIWDVGWRTARLCAVETYFDCPYYEQLQYVGDTRIQALISLYVSGDDRLMRQAIRAFDRSRTSEGFTACHYPGMNPQFIPPFSLYWINTLHDYWMYRDDEAFLQSMIPGIVSILSWYEGMIDPSTGMVRSRVPHWNFVDWVPAWNPPQTPGPGTPPESERYGSSIVTLHLADALRDAAELMRHFGRNYEADHYDSLRQALQENTYRQCWDSERGLLHDYIGSSTFSQHANIMGILTDAIPTADQTAVFERLDSDTTLAQATFYYRFYLTRALKKAGLGDRYSRMLGPWKQMLDLGLTTFAEKPEPSRSDCHAWSSSPNYEFLATICGIESAAPGFSKVRIAPHPGHLKQIEGRMPHPLGEISVNLKADRGRLSGEVILPEGLQGDFLWNGETLSLHSGLNPIRL